MQPLQMHALQRCRRTLRDAGHEIKRTPHAHGHTHGQLGAVHVNPQVLFGVAIRHKEDIRPRGGKPCVNRRPIGCSRRSAVRAGYLQPRIARHQPPRRLRRYPQARAKEVDAPALVRGLLTDSIDPIRSGDPLAEDHALAASRPQDASAIRHAQIGPRQRRGKGGIVLRVDDELGVDGADLPAGRALLRVLGFDKPTLNLRQRCREIDAVNVDAANAYYG